MRATDAPPSPEELAALEALFKGMDRYFSESEERRRFMRSANGLEEKDLQILQAALAGKLTPETAQKVAASADNPLRMAHALLELETAVKKSKDPVLLDFIFALLRSPKVTTGLDRLWFFPWEQALVLNKLLTQEQLRFIWQSKKEAYAKELVPDSMRLLAKHRQCPADVLEEMLPRDDAMLRKIIGMHANTSSAITRFFVNSPRKAERLHLATSRHASSEVLLSLLRDKHDDISRAARKNLAERFPSVQVNDAVSEAAVAQHLAVQRTKPSTPKPAFNPQQAIKAGHESVLGLDSAQRKRVADSTTDAALLRLLAADSSKAVRRAVARKLLAEPEVLQALAQDEDLETSNNALSSLFHTSPNATVEELLTTEALDTAHRDIAQLVAQGGAQSEDSEEQFTGQEKQAFTRMQLVAAHTRNPLIQLMLVKDLDAIPPAHTARWDLLAALKANRHLSEAVCRKMVVDLRFGGFEPLWYCNSAPLLREFLQPGLLEPHYHSAIHARLAELTKLAELANQKSE